MVKVERIDHPKSFITTLIFSNGNEAQEIQVYVWEADAIETKIQNISLQQVGALYNKEGTSVVKEW